MNPKGFFLMSFNRKQLLSVIGKQVGLLSSNHPKLAVFLFKNQTPTFV